MDQGKISVLMGIFNCSATLPAAIDSIIAQTYTNWELILCDDCSTDDTYAIAKKYAEQYPGKIILLKNEVNSRLAYSLNHCLKYATGEYIARMDGDDISLPERFETQVNFLLEHPEYDLVGCAMRRFNDSGEADILYSVHNPNYYTMRTTVPYHHATILAHRRVFDRLHGYTVSKRTIRGQDYDLWFRFYHEGFEGYNLREPLYLVREDMNAIRRRTFKVRWASFQTTRYGFKLLGYPKRWLIRQFFLRLFKSMIPYRAIYFYREVQKRRAEKL